MRKLTFIMILLFCATATYAQKGKVAQASSYLSSGKLDEAKKLIDEAITHENCVNDPKSYFVKGQIYQAIYESPLPDYKKLDPNALEVAWEAYQKVQQLDEKGKFPKKLKVQYENLAIDFANRGVEFYTTENFQGALNAFKKVLEIEKSPIINNPGVDTAIIFNAGLAAQKANLYQEAENYYKEALKYNYEPAKTYVMLASVLKEQGKSEEALQYLQKGYEIAPNDPFTLVELINYYLLGGEPEKAEVYLDAAIKQDPNNPSYYRAKGTLYEKMKQPEKAEGMYEKALSLDPKDFNSQYYLANLKLNAANELNKEVFAIEDAEEYNREIQKVYAAYANVIPYFEKALELQPGERNTMTILKELYFRLRSTDPVYQQKYDEMQNALQQQAE